MFSAASPRWKTAMDSAIEKDHKSIVYQLATVDTGAPKTPPIPRVRTLVHRGFLTPRSPALPLLLATTDIRTPKARQIAQNARVELVWWFAGTQEQFRIAGSAYIYPARGVSADTVAARGGMADGEAAATAAVAQTLAEQFPGERLGSARFDWEAKRREVFDSMSGHMKASWVRPVPGSLLPGGYAAAAEWPDTLPMLSEATEGSGGEEAQNSVHAALSNFALVVIEPFEVDYAELGVVPNQRTRFTRQGFESTQWVEEIVVP